MSGQMEEQRIINAFTSGLNIQYQGKIHVVDFAVKPHYGSGEGKTDAYIRCTDGTEIKISTKASNADFIENKISLERYRRIFGNDFAPLLSAINSLKQQFLDRQIIYPTKTGRIEAGSYTMGWRVDIVNKQSGVLCAPLPITTEQKINIFFGGNLEENKRNALINGQTIYNSGVANALLLNSENYKTAQEILDALIQPEDYQVPLYIAFKAVNYRSLSDKIDGNRPLGVAIDWTNHNNPKFIFDKPLQYGAKNDMLKIFKEHI